MARPSKYTFGRVKRLLWYLRAGGSKSAACGYAGITTTTLADWENAKVGFSEAIKRAMQRGERSLVDEVLMIAHRGLFPQRLTAAMFILNTTHGYKQQAAVEQTGTIKHEHSHQVKEAERIINRIKPEGRRTVIRAFDKFRADPN